jgi:predicted O-linked N-acetylglucosamine transferase (SPINDLY family)
MRLANRWPECFADGDVQFSDPQTALNHAMELHRTGRIAEADNLYRQLHASFPQEVDLVHLIGLTTFELGRHAEGIAMIQESLRHRPQIAHYHANYGTKLIDLRRTDEAIAALTHAMELEPSAAGHHYNLGNAFMQAQRWAESIAAYRKALELNPGHQHAALQLGMSLHSGGLTEEGISHYRKTLAERPSDYAIATNLGALLQLRCELDEAIEVFRHALAYEPKNFFALNNIAIMLTERGDIGESVQMLRRCVEISPDSAEVRSNLIFTLHYDPSATDEELAATHRQWNVLAPVATKTHPNLPAPGRRLRIGYVSADLRDHVVGRALLPVFRHHDHESFEIYCYATNTEHDITAEFRKHSDHWRPMAGAPDDALLAAIRRDQIDILIDLGLHTSDNRLNVFAGKPAPIQVSWLGYPESSGLSAMDYRISDRYLEPPAGNAIASPQEKAWMHPDCWTCFEPAAGYPEVAPLPSATGQPFTFGCFNNTCKVNPEVLTTWSRILRATPGSRLRLLTKQGNHRKHLVKFLAELGVEEHRVTFVDYLPHSGSLSLGKLLGRYHEIDLALDTFPYNGMSTTLDALWMGVPVVSYVDRRNLGRAGLSLLSNVGLPQFAVSSIDAYVETAVRVSQDKQALATLRAGLRAKMQASPLLDAAGFTRKLETGFRDIWVEWCKRQGTVG